MTTRRTTAILAGLAVTTALAVSGCSGSAGGDEGSEVDAERYYESYDESQQDTAAGGAVPHATAAEDGGAPVPEAPEVPEVPDPDEDNTFVDPGVNGFVPTDRDPLSTFALDVDTGSLGVARALLSDGYAVPAASVRPEEWVNAVPYDDPAPTDADLGLVAESGLAPTLDDGTQVVRVGVSAREVDPADRPRVNVTLVVDRSGSMDVRDRLGLVQSSLALLADRLEDDDTVSVVSFEDQAAPILEPTPVSDTEAILDAVERLTPGGGTNLEGGLTLGYEQARAAFDPEAVNLVVLCSDGVANIGATGPGSITDKIAEEGADGIHLVTVGFGMGNYNDHLMEQLADLGDGFYSYVDTYDEAEQLFGTDLTTTLVPVAAEARAQVAFDPEVVSSYRLIGYENRDLADEDFTDLGVDAGELGSGHHATALYEVTVADGVEPGARIGTASLLWRPTGPGTGEAEPQEAQVDLVAADPAADPSASLRLATVAADLAQVLKGAAPYADRGVTLDDLDERLDALEGTPGAAELADLVELARRVG
ncbi:von Willebrand factor type A domain-containing protein [Nocardioides sp.]|uniref:vWA domain-containing protein n=1 Tax=Nocardioides sp. TaxID=35761 RepID=UPI002723210C|nr:von Willebrand factor type A domain-containing protein [Nocardioides sp.]MDO9455202.1 von Willebrand factor type A domain-containing protein [Nocardioides sp.]